jgi:secondary thiamine-phosphate synthase enzyme
MNDWFQTGLRLPKFTRGFHLITQLILRELPCISKFELGFLQIFIMHTSASLTLNENADPDVRLDFETAANLLCPESIPFRHVCEARDDMPAHFKSSVFGSQLLIPIRSGKLALGVWQGIYLCEHRDRATPRELVLTLFGRMVDENQKR